MDRLNLWGALCLAVSGGFLLSALWIYLQRKRFLATSQPAAGTVLEIRVRGVGRNAMSFPVFEFRTAEGAVQRAESLMGTGLQRFEVGQAVPVRYDPRDPDRAEVDSFAVLWGLALLRAGFALLFLIMGIIGLAL
jgi:Protein of unknown function (DUF3592)